VTSAEQTEPPTTLESAHKLAERGWRVFPCEYRGKRPAVGIKWSVAAAAPPTEGTLKLWFGRDPVNIAVAARWSNLVILDEDELGAMEGLCAAYGQPVPQTYRVRTAKGWHWYFDAPQHVDIGNSAGLLADFGFDVRGGKGGHKEAGGYVVAAGSVHESGHVYVAEDDDADTIELPWWITELLLIAPEPGPSASTGSDGDPFDAPAPDRERRFTADQAHDWVKRYAIEPLKAAQEGGRNNALNTAAVVVGHFVPAFYDEEWAIERLTELAEEVGLERHEIRPTIRSGMRAGMAQPYALVEHDPFESGSGTSAEPDPAAQAAEHEVAVRVQVNRLRALREAEQLLAAEMRPPLQVLGFKEFLASPPLEYLVPDFLYRASTAKVYGPPGGTKSYFLLDLALALATGRRWYERDLPRTRVHYIMAEGQAVNTLRTLGWLTHHGVDADELVGWFTAIPQGVMLTPEGVREYLAIVRADQPGLVILDTKNRMMVGNENDASDSAVLVRAMDAIRETCRACVALVDHTGLTDQTRGRGSNAVTAAMDTEIRVTRDDSRVAVAEVTRDKANEPGMKVTYRLASVLDVPTPPGVKAPAVCERYTPIELPINEDAAEAHRTWADPMLWDLPTNVVPLTVTGKGKGGVADVARYMFHHAQPGTPGKTRGEMVKDVMKTGRYRDDKMLRDAWDALAKADRILDKNGEKSTAKCFWEIRPDDPKAKS
jgi:hypothetical protein